MSDAEKKISSEIIIVKHGPIKVTGTFIVTGTNGKSIQLVNPNEVLLCACGHSESKPLCDGSHNKTTLK